ncbi:nramp: Nramp-type metal ion transporter protein [Gaiella occulta]|uniref:Divalent metal cation transporter MntH n=1 Tax=Gaiella occulta TaxID=1002870 RepID=A0A7M2YW49_9ACTN|nr:nramp: Nramp-type metal ion transporter protein [Gaiella occulta]
MPSPHRSLPGSSLVVGVEEALPGEAAVLRAAERSLNGQRRGARRVTPFLGPAFIAAVAYVDPGNFATNMAGGAQFGYLLLWVVLTANLMAMLIQSMSAKLGIATGMNLPEVCRERFPRPVSFLLWIQAEAIAMATDLAEFIGAAIGINLLFGIPLFPAALLTGAAAFLILALQSHGFRRLESVIAGLVGVIVVAFGLQVLLAAPDPGGIARGLLVPGFEGGESVLLAVGILGATVMPHVIYLHSALTQRRIVGATPEVRRRIFRFELVDVVIAMSLAGLINMSMLITASAVFHRRGLFDVGSDLSKVYDGLGVHLGSGANVMFGIALLASGLSSSSVGTMAGQVVMQGFIRRRIPLTLRRGITMVPALAIIAAGVDPYRSLVISQVVLSFGIPFALIPLLLFSRDRSLMGELVNRRLTTAVAAAVATVIVALNLFLLEQTFFG